jgi:ABC-type transport system involved in multi-copper enzyme maturation permease subunit
MNPLSEIALVVARELRKNLRSVKGIVLLVMSLLGGLLATLGAIKLGELEKSKLADMDPTAIHALREEGLSQLYGDPVMGKYLADAPEALVGFLNITIWLAPLLIALLGFDAISGEIQHRTVRFWTVRTRRWSYYLGKFGGLWVLISSLTLVMHAILWIGAIIAGQASAGAMLAWGMRFWLVTLPITAAWCGLAMLISSQLRAPILALLVICVAFFALAILRVIGGVAGVTALLYLYPNYYDNLLLSPRIERLAEGIGACFAFAGVTTGLGGALFARRDV